MNSIFERLDHWADKTPDKLLYSFLDINGNQIDKYTYSEFIHRTNAIAGSLHNEYHFKKNDRILLAYPPGLEMICAFYACARLGLVPVPVYPPTSSGFESSLNKMTYIAKDCQAAAILTSRDYYWSIKLNLSRTNISDFMFGESYISKLNWINTEDFREVNKNGFPEGHSEILFLQYTSGSTSDPKGVMVSHQNILHNCDLAADHVPNGVTWLPQYHDMGLIGYYLYTALKGGNTYGFSSMDFIQRPGLWLETISKYKATASSAPNFAFDYCLRPGKISEKTLENLDLSCLQYLMTAAEPVIPSTYGKFLKFFEPYGLNPSSFFAAFGLAENTLAVSNYGRTFVSVDQSSFKQNKLKVIPQASETSAQYSEIMSCGTPLGDISVRIVDPETCHAVKDENIGEVWITGKSKCLGYWNKPELSKKMFQATIVGENQNANNYLRTGDIGFMYEDELYICGRAKDMIIIRGLNYYPQDIEKIAEETASQHVRHGFVAAFDIFEGEEKLVVVVGVKNPKSLPDPVKIVDAIRRGLNVQTHAIAFIPARDIPKTSSGKIMRHKAKELYLEGKLNILQQFSGTAEAELFVEEEQGNSPFEELKRKYGLKGNETYSLGKAGLESIDLVVLMHDIKELLKGKGADELAKQVDIRLIQEISISELFELVDQFENSSALAIIRLKNMLARLQKEHKEFERKMMLSDVTLTFDPPAPIYDPSRKTTNILLTGGTGFFGPFILRSLLEQTDHKIYVLVRASNEAQGMERLLSAMESLGAMAPEFVDAFKNRVVPVCGDLGQHQLGLTRDMWNFLANNIQEIYNNGAVVNYLFNYDKMRNINVIGTNEILKLAFEGDPKIFNHVSTTFIFGWAVKDVLYETDSNDDLDLLDFGYSQTKWVSEQIVKDAMSHGLHGRIFRPALITPSIDGGGHNFDISIRLLAFMINNGIGVDTHNQVSFTPADVAAHNIVAISGKPETINKTYHVVRDLYSNMMDITDIITKITGREFQIFKLKEFVPEVIDRCTKDDLLFPLLDFLVRSVENISSMEFKLYDSSNFKNARGLSNWGKPDPTLEDTVKGIVLFLRKNQIISV